MDLRDEQLSALLLNYFISPFRQEEFFRFTHTSDIALNEVFAYSALIFNEPAKFLEYSVHILHHPYHPKVKSGELYVVHCAGCMMDQELVEAMGIFKSENKDTFLAFQGSGGGLGVNYHSGVNLKSVDKGSMIFSAEAEDGFRVKLVDANSPDALFWEEGFLNVTELKDTNFNTKAVLNLGKGFSEEVFAQTESEKAQVGFISRSVGYFSKSEVFALEEFTSSVLDEPETKERFKNYGQAFAGERGIEGFTGFAINKSTVRSMKRKFRSFIKLDTQIEIRFSGYNPEQSEQYVERGFDQERGMHFYKVYFHNES